jgi:hypothetical protein
VSKNKEWDQSECHQSDVNVIMQQVQVATYFTLVFSSVSSAEVYAHPFYQTLERRQKSKSHANLLPVSHVRP